MEATNYIFQSPYTSQVQVGRPDPSSTKESDTTTKNTAKETPVVAKTIGEILQKEPQTTQQKVTPTITANSLDTYA